MRRHQSLFVTVATVLAVLAIPPVVRIVARERFRFSVRRLPADSLPTGGQRHWRAGLGPGQRVTTERRFSWVE